MSERLKAVRKALKLTQTEFGARLGVSGPAITKIEKGERNLTEQMFLAVCREYNVNEEWLRTSNGEMFKYKDSSLVARLADEYSLDDLDCDIITRYLNLGDHQRQMLKKFIYAIAEDEGALPHQEATAGHDEKSETVCVFQAAKSDDNRPMGYIEMSCADLEKLRNAPDVEEI